MATPFTEVYDFFLSKVSDYKFIKLNETGDLEQVLFKNLRSAIVRFTNSTSDLTIDESSQSFLSELTLYDKEVLSSIMVVNYVSGKILNVKNMEQQMSDKEYKLYSQANHLSQLIALKKELQSDVSQLMSSYNLEDLIDGLDE